VLRSLREAGVEESTLVIWVADNGPTTSELQNGGTVGPFVGRWAANVIDPTCYVCPADYTHAPTADQPRRCTTSFPIPGTTDKFFSVDGMACSADVGLGSTWEANLRMPAFARWPGRIAAGAISMELVSTLDIFTTGLSLANLPLPNDRVIDGKVCRTAPTLFRPPPCWNHECISEV
jgi:arylsulfatase A-like enzyme